MKKVISLGIVIGSVTFFALAANAFSILTTINQILNTIIPILISLAVVWFIWGVIQYLVAGDEEKKKAARGMIINGLIGLFIIIAFWGIIRLITTTFGVGSEQLNPGAIPCIPGPGVTC
jgi:4-hydroxybenzoate polyprenyltransferase